jgi:TolB-like protein/DNA-binding winged helix-turn-helix (wHTH) protein/Tfp pilus assembly protein PilF
MAEMQNLRVVRFGNFEVCFESGELRKAGMKVKVQPQPLKLLETLLERPGAVVTREELRNRIWPSESFGDFDQAVNIAVGKLRSALGDSAENPQFIETIPKRGYRFIAEVSVSDASVFAPSELVANDHAGLGRPRSDKTPSVPKSQEPVHSKTRWVLFGTGFVLAVCMFVVWQFYPRAPSPSGVRSLAVLPLDNFSGDPGQDYFADGMTDQLITDLAQISGLRVISRTSAMVYKGSHKPLPEIARELHVDAVVEGAVERSGERVRITAQLIEATTDKHLWADSYEEDVRDTLALQTKVAGAIAERIRLQLSPREQALLKSPQVVNPQAYEAYLKGRYFWNKRTPDGLKAALAYFSQAVETDPGYAQAYAGLADAYDLLGDWEYGVMSPKEAYPKAKAAALKALQLDHTLGEAHTSLAFSYDVFDWDWNSAGKEYEQAIALNPGYATAHQWYAWHLGEMGRNDDAIAEMRKAEDLDPLSLIISADMAEILLVTHRNNQAIAQSRATIAMDANFAIGHLELGQAYVQEHKYADAIAEFKRAIELSGGSTSCTSNLAFAYAASGEKSEALHLVDDLKRRVGQNSPEIALVYVALGDRNQAMNWLERASGERFNPSILLRPAFDSLRADPHFQELVHRIGLQTIPVQ